MRSDLERTEKRQSGIGVRKRVRVRIEKVVLKLGLDILYICRDIFVS